MMYCSLEYYEKVRETANSDEEFLSLSRGFTATILFKVVDRIEELPPVLMAFEDGKATEVRLQQPDEKTDYSLEAPYDIWMRIGKGDLDGATSIMTRDMKFFGSMGEIMKHAKAFQRLLNLMTEVPVEY
jgi:putative sterol carrier protein